MVEPRPTCSTMSTCSLQAAQEARLLLLDRQARGMRAQIAAMKEGRILSRNIAFSPTDRYPILRALQSVMYMTLIYLHEDGAVDSQRCRISAMRRF